MAKKPKKKRAEKPALFFNPQADKFKGIHKKAVRRYDKNGRPYYLNEKGRRVSFVAWRQVKTYERENKGVKKKRKRLKAKVIPLSPMHHKQFLSYIKNRMFKDGYKVIILSGSDVYGIYEPLGSLELFQGIREFYEANIDNTTKGDTDDLIWRTAQDIANKEILQSDKDVWSIKKKNHELDYPLLTFI